MPRVHCSIQDHPTHTYMIFYVGNQRLGPIFRYAHEQSVFDVLRRAHANLETLQMVELALRNRRPASVVLDLTDEQYQNLRKKRQAGQQETEPQVILLIFLYAEIKVLAEARGKTLHGCRPGPASATR